MVRKDEDRFDPTPVPVEIKEPCGFPGNALLLGGYPTCPATGTSGPIRIDVINVAKTNETEDAEIFAVSALAWCANCGEPHGRPGLVLKVKVPCD